MDVPPPDCELGYPLAQLRTFLDPQAIQRLVLWMEGQTGAICAGRRYDYDEGRYVDTGCGPHGGVIYAHDVRRWLRGDAIIDW